MQSFIFQSTRTINEANVLVGPSLPDSNAVGAEHVGPLDEQCVCASNGGQDPTQSVEKRSAQPLLCDPTGEKEP